jgi:hypothetical protein
METTVKMTPSELKYQVESHGHNRFFFTRDTMRFFGDTMRNYGVRSGKLQTHWDETGNHYSETTREIEVWELYRRHPVKHGLDSSVYFDKKTFRRVSKEVS